MRRSFLRAVGVLLTALTIWALTMVGWALWRDGGADAALPSIEVEEGVRAERQVRVVEVLAANRMRLASGEEVRLAAIEVPTAGEPFAEEGKQATRALVEGQQVGLVDDFDAAYIYLPEGQLLQVLLLSGGYARLSSNAEGVDLDPALLQAQQEARDANIGVWRGEPVSTVEPTVDPVVCDPSLVPGNTIGPEAAEEHVGDIVNVVFLPPRATTDNGAVTLLVGLDDEAFGVTIPAGLASTIEDPAIRYLNRCLVANGRIERAINGAPRVVLRSFDQLLILR